MKTMKKVLALLVAVLMIAASMSALAAGSIQLNDSNAGANSHDYKVYQIFTGTLKDGKLEDVKYGKNFGNTGASVSKKDLDDIGTSEADAITYAKAIERQVTGTPFATIKANTKLENVPDGYYLIVDDTEADLVDGDAYSRYMIQVVKDVEIAVKKSGTTSDKEIAKDTLGNEERNPDTTKIDNVSIGDTVKFTLTATVASDADTYYKYFFVMSDTLDAGFTFTEATANIVVKAGDATLTKDTDYKVYTGDDADGKTFQIAMLNAKDLAGQTITVTYQAVLNENCEMHEVPNKNTFYVTYSNNPKEDYSGEEDENHPGKPSSTSSKPFGETPEQHTDTYTTALKIKKVDQDGKSLAGATFTIEGTSLEKVVTYTESFAKDDAGAYWKLKNGSYTTDAPVERQMKELAQDKGVGYVLWTGANEDDEKVTMDGVDYRVAHSDEPGAYTLELGNTDLYDSTTTKYAKTETKQVKDKPANNISETLTVGADGLLKFDGLGAGTYTITEIAAPEGYTKLDKTIEVTLTFTAEPAEGAKHWSASSNAPKDDDGYFTVTVENKAGSTLPSTGGIGTTIFYVAGSLLAIGAAILLITKRRMGSDE